MGNKFDEKFGDIYGISNAGDPTRLEDAVRHAGFDPSDIDIVLNTHLHFDHAGGNTLVRDDGEIVPALLRPSVRRITSLSGASRSFSRLADTAIADPTAVPWAPAIPI